MASYVQIDQTLPVSLANVINAAGTVGPQGPQGLPGAVNSVNGISGAVTLANIGTQAATASTIPLRTAAGNIKVPATAANADEAASKGYVDALGVQAATGNTLAKRTAAGNIKVATTPANNDEAASKSYVDTKLAADPVWTAAALEPTWSYGGAPFYVPAYTKDKGWVTIRGFVTANGALGNGTVIFTLPAGFRPTGTSRFPVVSIGGIVYIDVASSGAVVLRDSSVVNTGWMFIENIRFAVS